MDSGLEEESFGNLTISSVSVIANGFIPKEQVEKVSEPEYGLNMGFVLGLAIPTVLILIVVLVVCRVKIR